jgi:hypothetical protein
LFGGFILKKEIKKVGKENLVRFTGKYGKFNYKYTDRDYLLDYYNATKSFLDDINKY